MFFPADGAVSRVAEYLPRRGALEGILLGCQLADNSEVFANGVLKNAKTVPRRGHEASRGTKM
jgi:hypothetical protein